MLTALFQDAKGGHGGGCIIWGEPGIGKSRLVAELTKVATIQGAQIQRVRCQTGDVRRPLGMWVDLVPGLLALPGSLGCDPETLRHLKRLTEHDASQSRPAPDAAEVEYLFGCVRRALFDLVDAVASETALVVVVESVHWMDAMSWEVLSEMLEWARARRVLFLMTSRTVHATEREDSGSAPHLHRYRLGALADEDGRRLVIALMQDGTRGVDERFAEWCLSVGEGNPYFLTELVSHWLETGQSYALPGSLSLLLEERLRRLSESALRVLQFAAVLGNESTFDRIESALGLPAHQLIGNLEELENQGLISAEQEALLAKHDLVSDAALARLSTAGHRLLHHCAAQRFENEINAAPSEPRSAAFLWTCSEHWAIAGEIGRAVRFAVHCAAHLIEVGLVNDGFGILVKAQELCGTIEQRRRVLRMQLSALAALGKWDELLSKAEDPAMTVVTGCQDDYRDWDILCMEALLRRGAHPSKVIALGQRIVQDSYFTPQDRIAAGTTLLIVAQLTANSDLTRTTFELLRSQLEAEAVDAAARTRFLLIFRNVVLDSDDALTDRTDLADKLVAIERGRGRPFLLARALRHAGSTWQSIGDYKKSLELFREALAIAVRHSFASAVVGASSLLAYALVHVGQVAEASQVCANGLEWLARSQSALYDEGLDLAYARVDLAKGCVSRASRWLELGTQEILSDPYTMRVEERLSLMARAQVLQGLVDPVIKDSLQRLFRISRTEGQADYSAYTLYLIIRHETGPEEALTFLNQYITSYRHEGGRGLSEEISTLGIVPTRLVTLV